MPSRYEAYGAERRKRLFPPDGRPVVRVLTMQDKGISSAVVGRLPRYLRYLGDLKEKGIERVSSQELSRLMNVTASQIRQDLNNFGGFGQQGYGYNVDYLYKEIGKILGLDREYDFIIIGAGNLGRALGGYLNFERRGFIFRGIFDKNPELFGTEVRGVKISPISELDSFIEQISGMNLQRAIDIKQASLDRYYNRLG